MMVLLKPLCKPAGPRSGIYKLIRYRFEDKYVKKLLKICWWNWNDKEIIDNIKFLSSDNIGEFLESIDKA